MIISQLKKTMSNVSDNDIAPMTKLDREMLHQFYNYTSDNETYNRSELSVTDNKIKMCYLYRKFGNYYILKQEYVRTSILKIIRKSILKKKMHHHTAHEHVHFINGTITAKKSRE